MTPTSLFILTTCCLTAILAIVLLAMLACSLLAVSFSSIYFILLSGTAGLCVYGVRQLRRGGGKP